MRNNGNYGSGLSGLSDLFNHNSGFSPKSFGNMQNYSPWSRFNRGGMNF